MPGDRPQGEGEGEGTGEQEVNEGVDKVEELSSELERLRMRIKEQEVWIRNQQEESKKPVMMVTGRKLDRFRGRPERAGDPTLAEWISDIRSHAESRRLNPSDTAAVIIDNLAGRARQEIQGRGDLLKGQPEEIFKVLIRVFGDGDQLPLLQERFYSLRQG
ncbi:uncharacterized protein LOC124286260, partial [Haliotis rubra]|uniref:uncharacterized protein LOC124286260 n=1 Tax=Haliotis rubra TaxID=36100 RepID=UPI001EE53134